MGASAKNVNFSSDGKCYKPLFDKSVQVVFDNWMKSYQKWLGGGLAETIQQHPDLGYDINQPYKAFCRWAGQPPDPDYYRPAWTEAEATWYQVYETVSEGTPVTPPFATQDELINYLCNHGTFWDDGNKWSREAAENFVRNSGYMSSMVIDGGGLIDQTQCVI